MTGKGHFGDGGEQATVGTVVISQQFAVGVQALYYGEEGFQVFGVVEVGGHCAHCAVHLRKAGGTQTVLTTAQVDQNQVAVDAVIAVAQFQLRGEHLARIGRGRKAGNNEGGRRGNGFIVAVFVPAGFHRHRVFAHRNGHFQFRAQFHTHSFHRAVQNGVFTGVAGGAHPVGRQFDVRQFGNRRGSQVGDGFGHRQTTRGRAIEQRHRSTLTHGHGFAGVGVVRRSGYRHISHRHLPRAYELITRHGAGNGTVADGDQEGFARHGGQAQHALGGIGQVHIAAIKGGGADGTGFHIAVHARRFAQQNLQRQINRLVAEVLVGHG